GVRVCQAAFPVGEVTAGDALEAVGEETALIGRTGQGPRGRSTAAAAEELDGVPRPEQDTDDLLDMHGGALGAEHGDSGVGADVRDPHTVTSLTRRALLVLVSRVRPSDRVAAAGPAGRFVPGTRASSCAACRAASNSCSTRARAERARRAARAESPSRRVIAPASAPASCCGT